MSEHLARVRWARDGSGFIDKRYSRAHTWSFDGGLEVRASASPDVVPVPLSDPTAVDPEEAYVASISSCHMLWFLALAAASRFVVDSYDDEAVGVMETDAEGRQVISRVTLRPRVAWSGERQPDEAALRKLHERAHQSCFIANSIKTQVEVELRSHV